ncbi:universal stress protein [Ralstonia syzygii]|nr:universal stress protein [Ralstonia syzygii]
MLKRLVPVNGSRHALDALRQARRILDDAGAHYVAQIKVGPVAETIAQTAAASACDMIVMGTAGRTPLGSLMAGRLSNRLIRMSRVPVTLVK